MGSSSGEGISGRDDGGSCSPCTRKQPRQAGSGRSMCVAALSWPTGRDYTMETSMASGSTAVLSLELFTAAKSTKHL